MCLAVPMRADRAGRGYYGVVELDGVRREVSLMLLDDAEVGEYLLIHAGYAIGKIDEAEADGDDRAAARSSATSRRRTRT